MWVDLSCPMELERWERMGNAARGQVYLYCTNLSREGLSSLRLSVTLLGHNGAAIGPPRPLESSRPVAPRAKFVLSLATDGALGFENLDILPERVAFSSGAVWTGDPAARVQADFAPLEPSPERVALVALAGRDAACFPQRLPDAWRCVCGRLNPPDQADCVRCGRLQAEVFEKFELEGVLQRHEAQLSAERAQREEQARAERRAQRHAQAHAAAQRKRRLRLGVVAAALVLVLAAAVFWTRQAAKAPKDPAVQVTETTP
jgi:hypothetical protein